MVAYLPLYPDHSSPSSTFVPLSLSSPPDLYRHVLIASHYFMLLSIICHQFVKWKSSTAIISLSTLKSFISASPWGSTSFRQSCSNTARRNLTGRSLPFRLLISWCVAHNSQITLSAGFAVCHHFPYACSISMCSKLSSSLSTSQATSLSIVYAYLSAMLRCTSLAIWSQSIRVLVCPVTYRLLCKSLPD